MKHLSIIVLVVLVSLFLAACGGAGGGGAQPDASGNLTIELNEYKFSPDDVELKVGQKVTIKVMNKGEKDHELMVGRNVMMMDGAPNGFEHDLFEGIEPMVMTAGAMEGSMEHEEEGTMEGSMEHEEEGTMGEMEGMEHGMDHGFMVLIPNGGDDTTVTFEVTENMVGEWELGCFQDDGQHYDEGMKGTLVVSK